MKNTVLFLLIFSLVSLIVAPAKAEDNGDRAKTSVIARMGISGDAATYHIVEVYQGRGRWIYPDVGYIDFAHAGQYREVFVGGGAVLFNNEHITIIEEGYIDKASGPDSGNAMYFFPWTYFGYRITPKISGETVFFPYLPLNEAGSRQFILERSKLEYSFNRFKVGAGYGAYQSAGGPWQNKPFITTTLKGGPLGNLELWLQKLPGSGQVQIRYSASF